jgi:hypothetical protein
MRRGFLNQIPYQCCWIWVDRTPGDDGIDMRTPFEGDRMLDESDGPL